MAVAEGLEVTQFLKDQPKKLFIGGKWVESASGKTFATIDPSTGEVLAQVAEADAEDVDRAVAAARKAHESGVWRELPPSERARMLWRAGDLIEERATEFAQLDGGTQQTSFPGTYLSYTLRQPVGVVGQIIPWNFPLLMASWKVAPALACGNTVV